MIALAVLVAVVAAARSTWSPCGLSMLSSITPFGERSRGHRYPVTAAWFIAGSVAGGVTLGGASAGLAAAGRALGLVPHRYLIIAGLALAGAAVDSGLFGEVLPVVRRQVDDRWLARYRPWVYGAGFGWQIGVGLATYVMTSAVVLLTGMAALTGRPLVALLLGVAFGVVRGSTVLLTSRASNPAQLRALHRFLDRVRVPVWAAAVGVQVLVSLAAAWKVSPVVAALVATVGVAGVAVKLLPKMSIRGSVDRRTDANSSKEGDGIHEVRTVDLR